MDRKLATSEAFLDKGAYDPMRHACADLFWFHVEPVRHFALFPARGVRFVQCSADLSVFLHTAQSFHPFLAEDISALKALEPQPATTRETTIPLSAAERAAQGEEAKADDAVAARTRSFPITQRLIAAFLDEGKGTGSANRALRQNPAPERTWMPGELPEMREFSRILERRIVAELEGVGLLSPGDDDEVAETMRLVRARARCAFSVHFLCIFSAFVYARGRLTFLHACVGSMAPAEPNHGQHCHPQVRAYFALLFWLHSLTQRRTSRHPATSKSARAKNFKPNPPAAPKSARATRPK